MKLSLPTIEVESVELCPFLASFRSPVRSRAERAGWRLWIRDSEGRVGEGEAVCWPGFGAGQDATSASLERGLAALRGLRFELAGDRHDLDRISAWLEAQDLAPEARHALETALLDLLAQAQGVPLACLFGPLPRGEVWSQALVSDAEQARAAQREGYRHFKLKLGASPLEADLSRVSEVRAALGPEAQLRVDANGLWSRERAARFAEASAELDLSWLEQPLPPGDLEGLAALRARGVRVAVDEGLRNAADLEAHLRAGALDAVVLKPAFLGGPLATLSLAASAAEAGLEVMVTHALDGEIGRLAALHVALAAPGLTLTGLSPALRGDAGPSGPRLTIAPGPWLPRGARGTGGAELGAGVPVGLGSSTAARRLARCEAVGAPRSSSPPASPSSPQEVSS